MKEPTFLKLSAFFCLIILNIHGTPRYLKATASSTVKGVYNTQNIKTPRTPIKKKKSNSQIKPKIKNILISQNHIKASKEDKPKIEEINIKYNKLNDNKQQKIKKRADEILNNGKTFNNNLEILLMLIETELKNQDIEMNFANISKAIENISETKLKERFLKLKYSDEIKKNEKINKTLNTIKMPETLTPDAIKVLNTINDNYKIFENNIKSIIKTESNLYMLENIDQINSTLETLSNNQNTAKEAISSINESIGMLMSIIEKKQEEDLNLSITPPNIQKTVKIESNTVQKKQTSLQKNKTLIILSGLCTIGILAIIFHKQKENISFYD